MTLPRVNTLTRHLTLTAAVAAVLAGGPAAAVVIDSVLWGSRVGPNDGDGAFDPGSYIAYAKSCPRATGGGTVCGDLDGNGSKDVQPPESSIGRNVGTSTGAVIYSTAAAGHANNSRYEWTNNLGYAFQVKSIRLEANGPVGTPDTGPYANAINREAGVGAIAAWELDNPASPDIQATRISDMRVRMTNRPGAAGEYQWDLSGGSGSWANNQIATYRIDPPGGAPVAVTPLNTWFKGVSATETYQTPIDRTFAATGNDTERAIAANDVIEIRLFEETQNSGDPMTPDAVLSDMTITIEGVRADLRAEALSFGPVRIGADQASGYGTIRNRLENAGDPSSGYRANGVWVGAATGEFSGGGGHSGVTFDIAAGGSVSGTGPGSVSQLAFGFLPTEIDVAGGYRAKDYSQTIAVSPGDALPVNFGDASEGHLLLTGQGVSPVAQLSAAGLPSFGSYVFDYTGTEVTASREIGFGEVAIGTPELIELVLSNIFASDEGANSDLTILALTIMDDPDDEGDDAASFFLDLSRLPADRVLAAAGGSAGFSVGFDPLAEDLDYRALLRIETDIDAPLGSAGNIYYVRLFGTGTVTGGDTAPLPGTLALLGLGILGLALRRQPARP